MLFSAQAPTISFCDAPVVLPRGQGLNTYSPALCFEYGNLQREVHTLKVFLLETGQFNCASNQWCGDASNPKGTFTIDNRDGSKTSGRLVEVRNMDVFNFANFRWVADLYNQAGQKIVTVTQDATGVAVPPPVLAPIGAKTAMPGQSLEFTVTATAPAGFALALSAQDLPPGATFNAATGLFRWPSPAAGNYSVLFKATLTGGSAISDAELVSIQVTGQPQKLQLSAAAYSTGEGGPALAVITRTDGSAGTVSVQCSTSDGTAIAGQDYTAISQTLTFAAGETMKAFFVPIANDTAVEPDETFRITLGNPSGAMLGATAMATVTVLDDDTPSRSGQWSNVINWPVVPIHWHLLPNGKVLLWDRHDDAKGWDGDPRLWDPATGAFSNAPMPGYDLFCAGHAFLADGRMLITGGHIPKPPAPEDSGVGENKASIYDAVNNSWTRLPDMNAGRWYPSNVTLGNGDVLVVAGTTVNTNTVNPLPQVWQTASSTWRNLSNALQGNYPAWADFYPFLYLAPNGKVFSAGPQQMARYLDTGGAGAWMDVAASALSYRDYGSSVLYDDGKVLIVGGNPRDIAPNTTPTILPSATTEVINLNAAAPAWRSVAPMSIGRRHHNATLLPDGKVLVTGGSSAPGFDTPAGAVLFAELWDPAAESWTILGGYKQYRGYHSNALLLPDGRVAIGGGGHPDPPGVAARNNIEIFSPPYLFKGARPTIGAAPARVAYQQAFSIETPDAAAITNVNWIRLGSATHGFDQNQRINRLSFTRAGNVLIVTPPTNPNLCPPGDYMLFILNAAGVPSVSRIVRISAPGNATCVSAANYLNAHAPEAITAAFGTNLATMTLSATTTPLPTTLGGTKISVRDAAGVERPAPLFFISPTQINFLMPSGTANGTASLIITSGDGAISIGTAQVMPVAPALFTANASGSGLAAGVALRVKPDGTQLFEAIARFDAAQNRFAAVPIDLGNENEPVFLVLYGSGIRRRSALSAATATIGGLAQPVLFAGAVEGLFGLDQVNVGPLSRSLIGRGEVDVSLTVDGKVANMARVSFK